MFMSLVRDLSEGCFDVLVFHHWEQGIRNAMTADLLIFDLTSYKEGEESAAIRSIVQQETGDIPSLLLIKESMLPRLDQGLMNQELLVLPARPMEIVYRAQRIIQSSGARRAATRLLPGAHRRSSRICGSTARRWRFTATGLKSS